VVGVGVFSGLGDGLGQAMHFGFAAPVERGQRPVVGKGVAGGVVGAFVKLDAADELAPANYLANETFDGIERGRAFLPCGFGSAADFER
jgi:hypothetical protein